MKNLLKPLFFGLLVLMAGVFVFTACTKEDFTIVGEENELEFRSAPPLTITTSWEEGATTILGSTVHTAQTNTVTVSNDPATGRVIFRRWDNFVIGRTNGAGDNGTANYAFGFKAFFNGTGWDAMVPFAFGTKGSREAIWTPWFQNVGICPVYMGLFVTDNGTGDQNSAVGIIQVGDFRAIDGDFFEGRPGKVIFRKLINGSWQQIGRTNGPGDDGNLLAFTVVNVRTDYTVSGGKVTAQTPELVPVAKIARGDGKTRLITDLPGSTIGTAMMYQY